MISIVVPSQHMREPGQYDRRRPSSADREWSPREAYGGAPVRSEHSHNRWYEVPDGWGGMAPPRAERYSRGNVDQREREEWGTERGYGGVYYSELERRPARVGYEEYHPPAEKRARRTYGRS